ncbi:hypothetical protein [Deinococcus peraridilitoris]|uniref:Uncharacterized protein n=1 Tax=Deinococcus peraridilitoris (strain DSM 19664 / LMG 22246 / CIP 109416 / KR-200) TaxID=937777 RepID=L0A0F7_DEIPD|nr:hypothetical protein [Deinococcus peraridilitoris]AFZ66944.1 hypothetical protein Deipe_1402 [Deinococcus peraridilitoris DSM 19664]
MRQARTVSQLVLLLGALCMTTPAPVSAQSALPAQPAEPQQLTQKPLLSGRLHGVRWALFAPGHDETESGTLFLAPPGNAQVIGAKYQAQDETVVLSYRSSATLTEALEVHDRQLQQQGFQARNRQVEGQQAQVAYHRQQGRVELLIAGQRGTYRVSLVLKDIRP